MGKKREVEFRHYFLQFQSKILKEPILLETILSIEVKNLCMNVSTVFSHCVQAYGFALCRNLEVTDAFWVDPLPIIRIIRSYGTI